MSRRAGEFIRPPCGAFLYKDVFCVILKRANLDGLMKNLERLERDSSEAKARGAAQNDGEEEILRKQRQEARLRMTDIRLPRGGSCRQRRLRESALYK